MAFDLIGRIKIRDDGASKAFDKVNKAADRARRATQSYKDANEALNRAQTSVTTGANRVSREINGVERASKQASRAMDSLGNKAKNTFRSLGSGLAKGALVGGIAALGGAAYLGGKSLGRAMDFEAQLSTIAALTGATNEQMAQMQSLALKMGASTRYALCLTAA